MGKKHLNSVLLILLSLLIFAACKKSSKEVMPSPAPAFATFHFNMDSLSYTGSKDADELKGEIKITNNAKQASQKSDTVFYFKRSIISMPASWTNSICDQSHCYDTETDYAEFDVKAGKESAILCHFYPVDSTGKGLAGTAKVEITINRVGAPSDLAKKIYFTVSAQ